MPQTCGVVRRADSGPLGTASSGVVTVTVVMLRTSSICRPRLKQSISSLRGVKRRSNPHSRIGAMDCFASLAMTILRRPASFASTRDLLDAGDQFVDSLVDRDLFAHHAVHRLGPDVFVVQDGELVVLGEVEWQRAAGELVVDGLAMAVGLPERALLACAGDREPAAEAALDIGLQVLLLQQEFDEFLALRLVLRGREDHAGLDVGAVFHRRPVRLVGEAGGDDVLLIGLLAGGALLRR